MRHLGMIVATSGLLAGVGTYDVRAVSLNPDGTGQALIYPYYTTRGGNDTLLTLTNTDEYAKAVRVRFMEGRNGRPVLEFNLYLSRLDAWSAAIVSGESIGHDGAGIVVADRSCTTPDAIAGRSDTELAGVIELQDGRSFIPFSADAYSSDLDVSDGGPQGFDRTREGSIEIIEMGEIIRPSMANGWIEHVNGEPGNCAAANRAWNAEGEWTTNPAFGMRPPDGSGWLAGNAMIVHPARGTMYPFVADGLVGFSHVLIHTAAGSTEPGLHSVNDADVPEMATAHVLGAGGRMIEASYASSEQMPFGRVDAITTLYASPGLTNDYLLLSDEIITAHSEWVLYFPTKRYYVDTKPSLPDGKPFTSARAPFQNDFEANGACERTLVKVYDREERTTVIAGGLPPPPGHGQSHIVDLCWQGQVLAFNQLDALTNGQPANITGSNYFSNRNTPFSEGWSKIEFDATNTLRPSEQGDVFKGLPITGFMMAAFDNSQLQGGTLANYAATFRHRTRRDASTGEP